MLFKLDIVNFKWINFVLVVWGLCFCGVGVVVYLLRISLFVMFLIKLFDNSDVFVLLFLKVINKLLIFIDFI